MWTCEIITAKGGKWVLVLIVAVRTQHWQKHLLSLFIDSICWMLIIVTCFAFLPLFSYLYLSNTSYILILHGQRGQPFIWWIVLTHPDTALDLIPFVTGLTANGDKHCLLATAAKLPKLEDEGSPEQRCSSAPGEILEYFKYCTSFWSLLIHASQMNYFKRVCLNQSMKAWEEIPQLL